MNMKMLFVSMISTLAALAYAQYRLLGQQQGVSTMTKRRPKNSSSVQTFPAATNPEQASHNLEYSDHQQRLVGNSSPIRDVLDADFAAEAHGFTGFETVGKGSRYKSSESV